MELQLHFFWWSLSKCRGNGNCLLMSDISLIHICCCWMFHKVLLLILFMRYCETHLLMLSSFLFLVFVSSSDLGLDQFIVKRFDGKVRTASSMWYREKKISASYNYLLFLIIFGLETKLLRIFFPRKLHFKQSKFMALHRILTSKDEPLSYKPLGPVHIRIHYHIVTPREKVLQQRCF